SSPRVAGTPARAVHIRRPARARSPVGFRAAALRLDTGRPVLHGRSERNMCSEQSRLTTPPGDRRTTSPSTGRVHHQKWRASPDRTDLVSWSRSTPVLLLLLNMRHEGSLHRVLGAVDRRHSQHRYIPPPTVVRLMRRGIGELRRRMTREGEHIYSAFPHRLTLEVSWTGSERRCEESTPCRSRIAFPNRSRSVMRPSLPAP